MKRALSIIAVITIMVLFYVVQIGQSDAIRKQHATRFSNKSAGTSVFYNLAENIRPGGIHLGLKPIFDDSELRKSSVYIMLEPLKRLSEKEMGIITSFVYRGGTAIISSRHIEVENFSYLLTGNLKMRDNPGFKNYQPTTVNVSYGENSFFPQGQYVFYANKLFDEAGCNDKSLSCFVKIHSYGKGQVVLFSGIPILANGLIGLGDNRLFAYKLIDENITLDEYHHNYNAKTFLDLLLTPTASLPIIGTILIGLLFFLFGTNTLQEDSGDEPKHMSAHDLRLGILQNILTKKGLGSGVALKLAAYIEKLCPTKKDELSKILDSNSIIQRTTVSQCEAMVAVHKDFLLERGE